MYKTKIIQKNKINFNNLPILHKILTIINLYLLLFYGSNNKYKNSNDGHIMMKHAILLLSSYGINYMNNFLSQFNNDQRFDIYIFI